MINAGTKGGIQIATSRLASDIGSMDLDGIDIPGPDKVRRASPAAHVRAQGWPAESIEACCCSCRGFASCNSAPRHDCISAQFARRPVTGQNSVTDPEYAIRPRSAA